MPSDRLRRMANDIAAFMVATFPPAEAEAGFANHVNDFWDPRMRGQLLARLDAGEAGFAPLVTAAANRIRPPRTSD